MPRTARKKSCESMYHVMSRSISETDLFRCGEDKLYYLSLLKRYKDKYHCRIYAYCIMDNHVHLYINPQGFDISKFMLSLNTAYAAYYNRRYGRHGHLFQGRFASTVVNNDTYSLTLSAYIHNNAKDLPGYAEREEMYRFSSYGVYTGNRDDTEGIIDTEYILRIFSRDKKTAREKYRVFTESIKETGIMKEVGDEITRAYAENEYRSEKQYIVRQEETEQLIEKIIKVLNIRPPEALMAKYSREASGYRAFAAYIMRTLCGYTYKRICTYIGNMSVSGVTRLTNEGFRLLKEDVSYRMAFNSLIQKSV